MVMMTFSALDAMAVVVEIRECHISANQINMPRLINTWKESGSVYENGYRDELISDGNARAGFESGGCRYYV